MMMATWRGTPLSEDELGVLDMAFVWRGALAVEWMFGSVLSALGGVRRGGATPAPLDFHQLRFFRGQHFVDFCDVIIREFLHLVLGATLFVFGYFLVLEQLLEIVVGIAADVADRHYGSFDFVAHHRGEDAAALLCERRQRDANEIAGGRRIESKVGGHDGLFHHLHHVLFPGRDAQGATVDYRDVRYLAKRHLTAVVLDADVIEQAGVGATGTDLGEFVLERADALAHLGVGLILHVADHALPPLVTRVPSSAP